MLGDLVTPGARRVDDEWCFEGKIAIRGGPEAIADLLEHEHTRVRIDVGAQFARRTRNRGRCKTRVGRAVTF